MIRIQTISAAAAVGLMLAAGLAFAQGPTPFPQADLKVIAAQDALQEAMEHLQNARNSNASITRAKAYIALAHTELLDAGGVRALQRTE